MSKYERFLIYPLLIIALVYGFIGNLVIAARQGTEVFERIVSNEIAILDGGTISVYNKEREKIVEIGEGSFNNGVIYTYNQNGVRGTLMETTDRCGFAVFLFKTKTVVRLCLYLPIGSLTMVK